MTLLSSKGTYGLLAMYELSKEYQFKKPVKIRDIAERAAIPQNYLEQLLNTLKKDGFVKSIRGAYGGYMLASDPSDIRVIDLLKSDAAAKLERMFDISLDDFKLYEQKLSKQICYTI